MTRLVMQEVEQEEKEEQASLVAIPSGRGKRTRKENGLRVFDRSMYAGPPPYPALQDFEVAAFVEEKIADDEPGATSLLDFPSPFERSLIPPDVVNGPNSKTLQELLKLHYWLQPTTGGLICRACFGRRTSKRIITFVTHPLDWSRMRELGNKVNCHLQIGKQQTARHRHFHTAFTEALSQLYCSPFPTPRGASPTEDVAAGILNTQHLVRLFQMASTLAAAKPLSESSLFCDLLATLEHSTRAFLRQRYNLSSSAIRTDMLNSLYFRLKERVVRKLKDSQFLCLLTDEAQDTRKVAHVSVVFKLFHHGKPEEVFWDLSPLTGAHTGDRIARLVCSMVDPLNCWNQMCALSTDGASSMSGDYLGAKTFF
ncbi:hypothetical protein DIPPA_62974 [Diplonema papillatum]|nr:hypothetical protein DIPPA_62974 [Diplonema papillatum]